MAVAVDANVPREPGTFVTWTCLTAGYVLVGRSQSLCAPDGRWSSIPRCVAGGCSDKIALVVQATVIIQTSRKQQCIIMDNTLLQIIFC